MSDGNFQPRRRRRTRRVNWTGVFFWIVVLALLITGIVFLTRSCDRTEDPQDTTPETTLSNTQTSPTSGTEPSVNPTTDSTTAPTTEPATEPTTEATVPATEPVEETTPVYNEATGQSIAATAKSVLGKAYDHGSTGPDAFDTTGLVYYCFRQNGISAPRALADQLTYGVEVSKEDLQPGDVVFFYMETPGEAEYVGIYIGDDTIVAVSSSQNAVVERNLAGAYFTERYVGARRFS